MNKFVRCHVCGYPQLINLFEVKMQGGLAGELRTFLWSHHLTRSRKFEQKNEPSPESKLTRVVFGTSTNLAGIPRACGAAFIICHLARADVAW